MSLRSLRPKDFLPSAISQDLLEDPLPPLATCPQESLHYRSQAILQLPFRASFLSPASCAHLPAHSRPAHLFEVGRRYTTRQSANPRHERGALGRRDHSTSIHQIKKIRALQTVVVRRKQRIAPAVRRLCAAKSFQQLFRLLLVQVKLGADRLGVASIETVL